MPVPTVLSDIGEPAQGFEVAGTHQGSLEWGGYPPGRSTRSSARPRPRPSSRSAGPMGTSPRPPTKRCGTYCGPQPSRGRWDRRTGPDRSGRHPVGGDAHRERRAAQGRPSRPGWRRPFRADRGSIAWHGRVLRGTGRHGPATDRGEGILRRRGRGGLAGRIPGEPVRQGTQRGHDRGGGGDGLLAEDELFYAEQNAKTV
jgi:hypothetical protein